MRSRPASGFTLLELLVVITILALSAVLVGLNLQDRDRGNLATVDADGSIDDVQARLGDVLP